MAYISIGSKSGRVLLILSIFFVTIYIESVNCRPSTIPNKPPNGPNDNKDHLTESTEPSDLDTSQDLAEDLLQYIIENEYLRDIIKKSYAKRNGAVNANWDFVVNPSSVENHLDPKDDNLLESEEMQGDMPVATSLQNQQPERHLTAGNTDGGHGEVEDGTIRHVVIPSKERTNDSENRESYLDETSSLNKTSTNISHATSYQKLNRESHESVLLVDRSKELRLKNIREQIMSFVIVQPQVDNKTVPRRQLELIGDLYNKMKNQSWPPAAIYTEKVQSFYPSCDLPKNTDEDLWHDTRAMNLLFDLTTPTPANGSVVNVIAAKLRLFKVSQGNVTVPAAPCSNPSKKLLGSTGNTLDEDKKIVVSIYWYTRSLKRNKLKRKLLEAKTLSVYGDEWVEFNVKQAAIEWRNKQKPNRNYGLVVEVKSEENATLSASQYLSAMNCSEEASTSRPIPGFLVDAARMYSMGRHNKRANDTDPSPTKTNTSDNNSVVYHSYLFPMIDLCTNEVPSHEAENAALYIRAQHLAQDSHNDTELTEDSVDQRIRHHFLGEAARTALRDTESPTTVQLHNSRGLRHPRRHLDNVQHRHRHNHGGIDQQLDPNGHELRKQIIQRVILANENQNLTESTQTNER